MSSLRYWMCRRPRRMRWTRCSGVLKATLGAASVARGEGENAHGQAGAPWRTTCRRGQQLSRGADRSSQDHSLISGQKTAGQQWLRQVTLRVPVGDLDHSDSKNSRTTPMNPAGSVA